MKYPQNAWKWRLKRATVLMFPWRERWKNDFTRHQEIFCKLAPYCLKAPSVGEGSLGVCWHLSMLGQNSMENSPPLVTVLQNVLYMHCTFDFLSCIQNINAKHGVGREILLSTAWSETLNFLPPALTWQSTARIPSLFAFPCANRRKR